MYNINNMWLYIIYIHNFWIVFFQVSELIINLEKYMYEYLYIYIHQVNTKSDIYSLSLYDILF